MSSTRPHIVILGAGFGGMYVARKLLKYVKRNQIDLTIVNKTNYFLFTPLLHEVATGALSTRSVAEPLREIFAKKRVHIVQANVDMIDRKAKSVKVSFGSSSSTINYDYLVIATGAETNYYGIPGADKFTLPLKNISDAAHIRTQVIDSFERAMLVSDPAERTRLLSFAVVGGGATGVEVAAELAEFICGMVKRYYSDTNCLPGEIGSCHPEEPVITLIHMGKELLEMFAPSLRASAERRLRKNGVVLQLQSSVASVDEKGLQLKGNMSVMAGTVIWAAGVKPIIPVFSDGVPTLVAGRMAVDQYFRLQGNTDIFALGDAAGYVDMHQFAKDSTKSKPLPMLAQVAVSQSETVAVNIISSIKREDLSDFQYHSRGSMVSVGQWFAIGEIFSMDIAGRLTWWLWRTVYLFKFASWMKRVQIAFEWSIDMFYPRDVTKMD